MDKQAWKKVIQIRIEVVEKDNFTWGFPIHCPRWLFRIIMVYDLLTRKKKDKLIKK